MTGKHLADITSKINELTKKFKVSAEAASNIKMTFKGLFSVVALVGKGIKFAIGAVNLLVKALLPGSDSVLSITSSLGTFIVALNNSVDKNELLKKSLEGVKIIISGLSKAVHGLFSMLAPALKIVSGFFEGTTVYAASMDDFREGVVVATLSLIHI